MKKLFAFLLTVTLGIGSLSLSAQSVTVGNGTVSNAYIPVYGYWMDADQHNQIIYPESMLTGLLGETINTLIFFLNQEPTSAWTSTVTISMGVTPNSSFSSTTHDTSPTSQVYSGTLPISGGTLSLLLDSTFTYNGGNLLVDITTAFGSNYSGANFYGVEQNGASIYQYASAYSTNGSVENFLPKTMFVYGSCLPPTNIMVDSIAETSAMVTWQSGGQETSWEIFVGNGTENLDNVTWIPTTDTFYEIQGLSANTLYTITLRSNCGTEYSYSVSQTFRTACGVNAIPFVEDFEGLPEYSQPACWQFLNAYSSYYEEYPTVTSDYGRNGTSGMYFLPDYYNPGATQIAILPPLAESITELQLSLYSRRASEYSSSLYIGYITNPTDASTFVPIVTLTADGVGDDEWHRSIVNYSDISVDPEATVYLAIGYLGNTYSGWMVDDIEVTLIPDCSVPVGMSATATATTATLSWNPGTATTFNVYYKKNADTSFTEVHSVSDSSLMIEELTPANIYQWYVAAVCDDGTMQIGEESSFTTTCVALDTLPYVVDFELAAPGTQLPFCWTRGNEYTEFDHPYIDQYAYDAHSGSNSLYFYYTNTVALPEIDDEAIDLTLTHIAFYAKASSDGTQIQVGVMTNPVASSTFVPMGTISLTQNYQLYEVSFNNYTGNGKYVAFRNPNNWNTLYIDDVTFEFLPDCARPESIWLQSVTTNSATIGWSTFEGQSQWEAVICAHGTSPDAATGVTVSAPTHTFTGLTNNTTYDVYVRTVCGEESSAWSNVLVISTLNGIPATVPYLCDFENATENAAWTIVNGYEPNKWYIDTAVATVDNSINTLYISNDSAVTNSYNHDNSSTVWAYRDIQFSDAYEFELSFDWKGYGESCCDYLKVFIGNPAAVVAGDYSTPTGAVLLGQYNNYNSWNHVTHSLGSSYSNTTKRVYFMWRNDSYMGYDPAIAIDNIAIAAVSCAQPASVVVTNINTTSATLTITPSNPNDAAWEVKYGNSDTTMVTVNVSDATYQLTNLIPSTSYDVYVRTLCGGGDTSVWAPAVTFQTSCLSISTIPQSWDLETNNIGGSSTYPMPACWDRGPTSSSYPYINSYNANSGYNSLYYYNYYKKAAAILPEIDTTELAINNLQLTFYAKGTNIDAFECYIIVGVFSDIYSNDSFVPVDTVALTDDYPNEPYVVMFNQYTGNGNRIAILNYCPSNDAYNSIYVDDITLEELPSCLPISNLTAVSNDMSSITLDWTEGFDEASWNVDYKEASDTVWTSLTANNIPFTISNLTAGTVYDIRVQADCGGDYAPWRYLQAATQICDNANQCDYTFLLTDDYGDGWNGGYLMIKQNGIEVSRLTTINHHLSSTQSTDTVYATLCNNMPTELVWHNSQYTYECSFTMIDPFGTILYTADAPTESLNPLFTFTANCFVPSCPAPTGITVSSISMSEATVSWTPGGDETNWNVEYKLASDTVWTVVPVTTNPYTLTNLTAASAYDVRVQAECNPTDPNPSVYCTTSFHTSTCSAANQCTYTFNLSDGYGDGWNNGYLTVMQNDVPLATVTLEDGASGTETVALCDNVPTSLVWTSGSYADEVSFTLLGPDGTQIYTYSDMTGYTTYTFTTDCGGDHCDVPTDLHTTAVENNAISIAWNTVSSATGYNIQYRVVGQSAFSSATANTNSYTINDLQGNTNYEIQVQANCGNGNLSDWSDFITVQTHNDGISNWLDNSIVLFPNPANDVINVQCTTNNVSFDVESIEVYDVYGKIVRTGVETLRATSPETTRINVAGLAAGMYFVRVTTDAGTVTKSFVKN